MNAVYDRQIRLWGAEAQKRIGETRALVVGLGGVNVELTKNLVLAGISVTLWDEKELSSTDLGWNFFADVEGLGKNRAEACVDKVRSLNKFADIRVAKGLEVKGHQVVLVEPLGLGFEAVARLNEQARELGAYFYYFRADADKAVAIVDLGKFQYRVKIGEGENAKLSDYKVAEYPSFREIQAPLTVGRESVTPDAFKLDRIELGFDEDVATDVKNRHNTVKHAQLGYINAVFAGILGQEVIKAISQKGQPTNNILIFETATSAATVYKSNSQPAKKQKIDPSLVIEID